MDLITPSLNRVIELSTYTIIGWIVSWIVFFLVYPIMLALFGKVQASVISYGISWIAMILVIFILEYIDKNGIAEIIRAV